MRGILKCLKKLKKNKKEPQKSTDTTDSVIKLISRRHSLGARPLSAIPLSSSLRKLASEVWNKRATIKNSNDIYSLYSCLKPTNVNEYSRMHGLTRFFREILFLGIEMNMKLRMQSHKKIPLEYLVTARENYVGMRLPIANAMVKMSIAENAKKCDLSNEDYLVGRMARDFFYFSSKIKCSVRHRVYLNVNNISNKDLKSAGHILGYIIREIMHKINGVKTVKITVSQRVDTILIYTSSVAVSNKVIAKIQEYQNNNGISGFGPEIPMMTEEQIYGVATGYEPPTLTMKEGQVCPNFNRQSFGRFRVILLYKALKDSTGCSDFFELIVKYFMEAGIDASQPAVQLRYGSSLWEAQRSFVDKLITGAANLPS